MAERLFRIHQADLEVRSEGGGRTITGLCVPYGVETPISEGGRRYTEVFNPGVFARTLAERGPQAVKFKVEHDRRSRPIGRASLLREDAAGLYGEFKVSATRDGDEVIELVRDQVLTSLSVGFRPIRDRWTRDRSGVERLEAALAEVSVVEAPAYAGALITGIRSQRTSLSPEAAARRLALLERSW